MPELQLALPKADLSKISKLQQRLTAPSNFSTDFLFPGIQAFFKEFVVAAEHNGNFMEQLKVVLINELIEMNDSSYEIVTLAPQIDSGDGDQKLREYVVLPQVINKMRVLAKFIGFILTRHVAYDGVRSTEVDQRQIQLRNVVSFQ